MALASVVNNVMNAADYEIMLFTIIITIPLAIVCICLACVSILPA